MCFVSLRNTSLAFLVCLCRSLVAQDPSGVLEGQVRDASGALVSAAAIAVTNRQTGFSVRQLSADDGSFHFSSLLVGEYDLRVWAEGFAPFTASAISIDIGRTIRILVKIAVAAGHSKVNVSETGRRIQFRAASFNVVNRANFQLPQDDIASPEFGQILEAAPPRLFQLALKLIF